MRIEKMLFGARLRQLRIERGMTQEDVSKILGCTQSLVSHYEAGIAYPSVLRLVDFSSLYLVSLDYLLRGEGSRSNG